MKHTIRISVCLILALCLLSLTSCAQWRTDVSVKDLTSAVKQAAPYASGWIAADSDYISASAWGEDHADYMAKVEEYTILLSGDLASNVNEIGIFRLGSASDAKAFKGFVEDYLAAYVLRNTPILEGYNPSELTKLDNAKVTVYGVYVVYTILNTADTAAVDNTVERLLKAE